MKIFTFIGLLLLSMTTLNTFASEKISIAYPGKTDISKPAHGQSMEDVTKTFGDPLEKTHTIGNPPINRWRYEKYTVYFEQNIVIHSVINKK